MRIFPKHLYTNIHKYLYNNISINTNMYNIMNIHRDKILKLIKEEKVVTSSEIAKHFKISWNTANKYLLELLVDGKVDRIKKLGVTLWMLK